MSFPDPWIDRVFDGRYRIVRKLGTGGMAIVYLAEDQELGRRVALKMLDRRHAEDQSFVERFRREAQNVAGLSHANIVAIYDRGEAEGTYYIAMEHLEGKTLKELIVSRGATPIQIAVDYTRQILAALAYAHRNGIVHRDIKPHNIVVAPDGRLKVMDFGIARSEASEMTEVGSIIGTAQYLSPEQARGAPVDQRSDLYSVGIVLYEMLTGAVPFNGETPLDIAMKHLSATPEAPSAKRPEIPHELDLVVLRSLAKSPEDRFQSADEMEADLARVAKGGKVSPETEEAATAVLSGTDVLARAPTQVARPRAPAAATRVTTATTGGTAYRPPRAAYEYAEPVRRRPVWPWIAGFLLLIAAGFAGFYVYDRVQDQLAESKPVIVEDYRGLLERLAVDKIRGKGLRPRVIRAFYDGSGIEVGHVFRQRPDPGEREEKGNTVTIWVSKGVTKIEVPNVVGEQVTNAVKILTQAGLEENVVYINSQKEAGTVTAQDPRPGVRVVKGTKVRINVSKGVKPVEIPNVIGRTYEQAASELQAAAFAVARRDVESDQPAGVVIGTDPDPGTQAPRGSTVTVFVSEGPQTSAIPDVTSQDAETARSILRSSGFRVVSERVETSDPSQDGIVLSQDPEGGTQAEPGTLVTIAVGRYVEPPPATTPTITVPPGTTDVIPPTDTVPTDTTPTDTVIPPP